MSKMSEISVHVTEIIDQASKRYGIQNDSELREAVMLDFEDDLHGLINLTVHDVVEIADASGIE